MLRRPLVQVVRHWQPGRRAGKPEPERHGARAARRLGPSGAANNVKGRGVSHVPRSARQRRGGEAGGGARLAGHI
eukprot:3652751-Rhodomonas_salina.1